MRAYDTCVYSEHEVERIARVAFDAAQGRRKRLHSVDKANVLETSRLWREVVHRVAEDYTDVEVLDMLVDNAAMQLVRDPAQFDVIVTENMFGDILSDEASMLTGSLGMLASASLGDGTALFEPSHGSAPDIAGLGVANPLAMLLSVELMLRHSLGMPDAADALSAAIERVLTAGYRTRDVAGSGTPQEKLVGTAEMGDLVVSHIHTL
jgi:3-isopropylmalate dehydrogenase